jgi:hypothetical protein
MSLKSFLKIRSLKDYTNAFFTYSLTTNNIIASDIKTSTLYVNTYMVDSKYNDMMAIVKNGVITFSKDVPNKLIELENRILFLESLIKNINDSDNILKQLVGFIG